MRAGGAAKPRLIESRRAERRSPIPPAIVAAFSRSVFRRHRPRVCIFDENFGILTSDAAFDNRMQVKLAQKRRQDGDEASVPRVLRPRRAAPADAVRPTRAEINLGHLRHNLKTVRRAAPDSRVFGVLKADGYGHGAPAVARTLERAGIDGFCVALVEEAVELREAGIRAPLLVMGGAYYGQAWAEVVERGITPVIFDVHHAECLAREVRLRALTEPVSVHFKIDTGMGRLGCDIRQLAAILEQIRAMPEIRITGLMTHFAGADEESLESVDAQLALFQRATEIARSHGVEPTVRHAANSAALFRASDARLDWVRPGISLFGIAPQYGARVDLRPVMKIRTEIVATRSIREGDAIGYGFTFRATRESRIATIPMGYADGLSRHLSNRGDVLVRGRRAKIVGSVSMDLTMIDITDHEGVGMGEEVVVLGPQQGKENSDAISAEEIARHAGTIPWDVLTSVSRRVPRFYREP
jgi:alanine racemase